MQKKYDVVIAGAGLAGLCLSRQLLLETDKRILLLDKSPQVPASRQKYGESLVQLGGYYMAKVLEMEEYLLQEHYLKYNLRFHWERAGARGEKYEEYNSAFITKLSNVASYQLDRNRFEAELLKRNLQSPRLDFCAPATGLQIRLDEKGPHRVTFKHDGKHEVEAEWVVDTTGRSRLISRQMGLARPSPIRHGSSFAWVEGLVDIEKLTDASRREILLRPDRRVTGHLPFWLATNHFMGEGFWFWVIPLYNITSLGLVYDSRVIDPKEVSNPQKLIEWACRRFPLFERDLPRRKVLDRGSFVKSFSYDCKQTISASKWALCGEAGRFSDPLYSPGSDLIALHNTLIVDAVQTDDPKLLARKAPLHEQMMVSFYEAYVPSYSQTYDVLGDQETFILKYVWELTVYFAFYVFPFLNQLFTDREFQIIFLNRFARLGPVNRGVQAFLTGFYQWKKQNCRRRPQVVHLDFLKLGPLQVAEQTFYEVGLDADEARRVLDEQVRNLRELARFIVAHGASVVLQDESLVFNKAFVESIDVKRIDFDVEDLSSRYARCSASKDVYEWPFCIRAMPRFDQLVQERKEELTAAV